LPWSILCRALFHHQIISCVHFLIGIKKFIKNAK
jgi:hypothetical protein